MCSQCNCVFPTTVSGGDGQKNRAQGKIVIKYIFHLANSEWIQLSPTEEQLT